MPPTAASLARGLFVNGVFNNLGYVVMLSAAKSILPQASVAYVLLFDDTPALLAQVRVDGRGVIGLRFLLIACPLLPRFTLYSLLSFVL